MYQFRYQKDASRGGLGETGRPGGRLLCDRHLDDDVELRDALDELHEAREAHQAQQLDAPAAVEPPDREARDDDHKVEAVPRALRPDEEAVRRAPLRHDLDDALGREHREDRVVDRVHDRVVREPRVRLPPPEPPARRARAR